jgi:hypothetical protein
MSELRPDTWHPRIARLLIFLAAKGHVSKRHALEGHGQDQTASSPKHASGGQLRRLDGPDSGQIGCVALDFGANEPDASRTERTGCGERGIDAATVMEGAFADAEQLSALRSGQQDFHIQTFEVLADITAELLRKMAESPRQRLVFAQAPKRVATCKPFATFLQTSRVLETRAVVSDHRLRDVANLVTRLSQPLGKPAFRPRPLHGLACAFDGECRAAQTDRQVACSRVFRQ